MNSGKDPVFCIIVIVNMAQLVQFISVSPTMFSFTLMFFLSPPVPSYYLVYDTDKYFLQDSISLILD